MINLKKCVFILMIVHLSMPLLAMKRSESENIKNVDINQFWNDKTYQETIDLEKQRQEKLDKALVEAVIDNDFPKLKKLIGKGANIYGIEQRGAIFYALENVEPEILRLFIEIGLDPNKHIIDSVRLGGEDDEDIVSPLLVIVSSMNRPENVQYLLEQGAKVHVCDAKGISPLLAAVKNNNQENVKILLAHKANPDDIFAQGQVPVGDTPLITAVCNQHFNIAKLLLDCGADPNLQPVDKNGNLMWGPLSWALHKSLPRMASLLLFYQVAVRPEHIALAEKSSDRCLQRLISQEKFKRVVEAACCMDVIGTSPSLPEELKILLIAFLWTTPLAAD